MIISIIAIVLAIFFGILNFYLFAPALSFHSPALFVIILISALIAFAITSLYTYWEDDPDSEKVMVVSGIVTIFSLVILAVLGIASTSMFHAPALQEVTEVKEVEFSEIITESETISDIALMDSATGLAFAKRELGELNELVSTYDVTSGTTFIYNGKIMKVYPLEYKSLSKYLNKKDSGIPGYVLVDPVEQTAHYVKAENPFFVSPSAFFYNDLKRTLRRTVSESAIFDNTYFELDDSGNMYWITPIMKQLAPPYGGNVVEKIIITDATTKKSHVYALSEVPEWVDTCINGEIASKYFDWHAMLKGGFWNSVFAQENCSKCTNDYGYKHIGNDVYIYTGVTSANGNTSNIGFMLTNSRTGEMFYMPCTGASESSAMSAAQGEVANFGYHASFPSIINVDGEAVYMMVLKDDTNITKRYAIVNAKAYNIIAIGDTQKQVLSNYRKIVAGETVDMQPASDSASNAEADEKRPVLEVKDITVSKIQYIVQNGETTIYVVADDGSVYKTAFDESFLFVNDGDTINISILSRDNIPSFTKN